MCKFKVSNNALMFLMFVFLWGLVLFLYGFFPGLHQKLQDNDHLQYNETHSEYLSDTRFHSCKTKFNRTVLMMVDALRYDFISVDKMPFTMNRACGNIKMETGMPTVTMPRIKSLVTGTLSNFIDIILNLGYVDVLKDSILHRMTSSGHKIIFAGDNVWIKLFPQLFQRAYPNVDAFYVNDFYEGDKNVTKAVLQEIHRDDWNLMILHYLGLDHIGHVEGTASSKIPPKLLEMDEVIKSILLAKPSNDLVLITADHGMRNGGGHGGGSVEEIYVPLLYFVDDCRKLKYIPEHKQIDLTPTLAVVLCTDIPKSSLGCLIPELLEHMNPQEQLYAYYSNSRHLLTKAMKTHKNFLRQYHELDEWFKEAEAAHKGFLDIISGEGYASYFLFEKAKLGYIRCAEKLSALLLKSLNQINYIFISIGLILTTCVTFYIIFHVYVQGPLVQIELFQVKYFLYSFFLLTAAGIFSKKVFGYPRMNGFEISSAILTINMLLCILQSTKKYSLPLVRIADRLRTLPLLPFFCVVLQIVIQLSTSYIEEEHLLWYYFSSTIVIVTFLELICTKLKYLCQKTLKYANMIQEISNMYSIILVLIIMVPVKKLNASGEKWRHIIDLSDILNYQQNKLWLFLFIILGMTIATFYVVKYSSKSQVGFCLVNLLLIFLKNLDPLISFSSQTWSILIVLFFLNIFLVILLGYEAVLFRKTYRFLSALQTNLTCMILISLLLHKSHNIILNGALLITTNCLLNFCDQYCVIFSKSKQYELTLKVLIIHIITKMFFYCQGNSNGLATIDVTAGFVGQTDFNPFIASILITINTYNAEITTFLMIALDIVKKNQSNPSDHHDSLDKYNKISKLLNHFFLMYAALRLAPASLYMFILFFFRNHIFIYSVFSPKMLYISFNVLLCLLQILFLKLCLI